MIELLKMEADLLKHNVVYVNREASDKLKKLIPSNKIGWLEEEIPEIHAFMMGAIEDGSIITPKTYEEAIQWSQSKDWRMACIKEI